MKDIFLFSILSLASLGAAAAAHGDRGDREVIAHGHQHRQVSSSSTHHVSSTTKKSMTTSFTSKKSSKTSKKPSTSSKKTSSTPKPTSKSSAKSSSNASSLRSSTTVSTKPTLKSTSNMASTKTSMKPSATPTLNLAFKAGLSGFPGIDTLDIFHSAWVPLISWYSNYLPVAPNITTSSHTVVGAPMLWGKGDQCLTGSDGPVDRDRLSNFTAHVTSGETTPEIMFGFYEPDCNCDSSSHIPDTALAAQKWNQWLKPLSSRGILLGSPPMCTQLDQSWLSSFASQGVTWDITSVHVNKPTVAKGISVVEYYYAKFGKPVWVSEFTCVNDTNWSSCGDQATVNKFIDGMVEYFEGSDKVVAYGANNGEGVPGVWNLMTNDWPPQLTETGKHYQAVLKGLAAEKC